MSYAGAPDPLCYSGSNVLINLAGLRSQAELDEFEFAMYLSRAEEPLPAGSFDAAHYRSIHHHLFQDVYSWAGKIRRIRIAKGGNWFCYPEHIERELDRLLAAATMSRLLNAERNLFILQAASLIAELKAIHPFREGNGRTQLVFLNLIAATAGFELNPEALDPSRVLSAMISSFGGEIEPLEALIGDLVG